MNKSLALILTPVVLLATIAISLLLAVVLVVFLAFNPLFVLGFVGILAVLLAVIVISLAIFTGIMIALFVFGTIYFILRDVNEPFQRTESKDYSPGQQEEVGRKKQSF